MSLNNFVDVSPELEKYPQFNKRFKNLRKLWGITEDFFKKECIEYMTKTWNLRLDELQEVANSENFVPWTLFEKKYVERGETCYRMSFSTSRENSTKQLAEILSNA